MQCKRVRICKKCKNPEKHFSKIFSQNWRNDLFAAQLVLAKECPCKTKTHHKSWEKEKHKFLESKGFYVSNLTKKLTQFSQDTKQLSLFGEE